MSSSRLMLLSVAWRESVVCRFPLSDEMNVDAPGFGEVVACVLEVGAGPIGSHSKGGGVADATRSLFSIIQSHSTPLKFNLSSSSFQRNSWMDGRGQLRLSFHLVFAQFVRITGFRHTPRSLSLLSLVLTFSCLSGRFCASSWSAVPYPRGLRLLPSLNPSLFFFLYTR